MYYILSVSTTCDHIPMIFLVASKKGIMFHQQMMALKKGKGKTEKKIQNKVTIL